MAESELPGIIDSAWQGRKELANADGVLRQALKLDPQNLSAHYLSGQTLMQEAKTEEAKKEMETWNALKCSKWFGLWRC